MANGNSNGGKATVAVYTGLALIAGLGGSVGYQAVVPPRPDPWTHSQADTAHDELRREWRLDMREIEHGIREDMPPTPTRRRIEALEDAIRDLYLSSGRDWRPPGNPYPAGNGALE